MELLDERWTMLVVRELLLGSKHFNELRRDVPKMSPALLSKRLQTLTRAGVVQRTEVDDVVQALSVWGVRRSVATWLGQSSPAAGPRPA
jgi:DNA-binding HxlR family transcriptional regulator